jgi:hypothetical protein
MKLVGKVPVEPLDDERLTNIERSLVVRVSEMSQQRGLAGFAAGRGVRRLFAVAAIAMAVLVAGVVGWRLRGNDAPVVESREQLAMKAGALDLGDAQITGTDFTVTRTPSRVEIVMQPGMLDLHVDHRPDRLFVVKAGNVEIEDVGTRFTVDYDGKNVDVRVTEGEVKVKHAGKDIAITASNAWTLELGPITIAELQARAQQVATAQPAIDPKPASTPSSATTPSETGDSPTGEPSTVTSDLTAGSAVRAGSGSASATKKPGKTNARKALENAPLEPPDEVGSNDPKTAISSYLERIKSMPDGEDKARVLYSIAYMQHRAKQDGPALHSISGVVKRQGGPAYKAALWLRVRILCMKTFDDECRMATQNYLAKFSDGLHAGIAQEILKDISRGP